MTTAIPKGCVYVPNPPGEPPQRGDGWCETVRVVDPASPDGWCEIDQADFDPARHELFEGEVDVLHPSGRIVHP